MNTLIAWNAAQGHPVYPDANGTLRVAYGNVFGGSPRDGIVYEPFTRLEGIVEKDLPRSALAKIDIETCGRSRIPLGGLVQRLHQANLEHMYSEIVAEKKASSR